MLKSFFIVFALWHVCNADSMFNIDAGLTQMLQKSDDGTIEVTLPGSGFPYFGQYHTKIYVGMNGIVSFGSPVTAYDTRGWPTATYNALGASSVLPFWSDVNGYFLGKTQTRAALASELASFTARLVADRATLTGINLKFGTIVQWTDISPCGCFFPRNTVQLALVTDGCSSYAMLAYPSVNWGNSEGARVGSIRVNPASFQELPASQTRSLQSLVSGVYHLYFGGENMCTGQVQGTFIRDTLNQSIYYVCGECSVANTIVCEPGKHYDQNCQKCVLNPHPHCDNAVDGNYGPWTDATTCSHSCGPNGQKTQTRLCNNPAPSHGGQTCIERFGVGSNTQIVSCNTDRNCPINGGWGPWVNTTVCSRTCAGGGQLTQVRSCNNPVPQFGGLTCLQQPLLGPSSQIISCNEHVNCPIDGVLTAWVNSGNCTASCGGGLQRQVRSCIPPQFGGAPCSSTVLEQFVACNTGRCPDICTNANAADNTFIATSLTTFCLCMRLPDNTLSYIQQCDVCPAGTTWNAALETCTVAVNFQCTAHPFCQNRPAGDYSIWEGFANASCSHLYYTCDAQRQLQERSCGVNSVGNYFNALTRQCVTNSVAPATCPNYRCVGRSNGNYERFSDECEAYYRCTNFVETHETCPVSTPYYDNVQKICVAGPDPPAGQNCIHPQCKGLADGYYVVDNRCDVFFRCVNQRRVQFTACGVNEYYNSATNQCGTTYPAGNQCQHKFCIQSSNLVAGTFATTTSSCGITYNQCSGPATNVIPVPNILTSGSCPLNTFFQITNAVTLAGSCSAAPPATTCPNWRCIGRSNGFRIAITGIHDCRNYYECNNQIQSTLTCPNGQYFSPVSLTCTTTFDALQCQHPDCLAGGRQGGPGDYAIIAGSQCSHQFYRCATNLLRTTQSCVVSTTGQYFGMSTNGVWGCLSGNAPSSCPGYICVGKTPTNFQTLFPLYNDPADPYCRNYIGCANTGSAHTPGVCAAGSFLSYTQFQCLASAVPPVSQSCRVDGGFGAFSNWAYVVGSTCSVTCGDNGYQLQTRSRLCNNPVPQFGGANCDPNGFTEFRNSTCQNAQPPCGDAFCINGPNGQPRVAGSYSRTLTLVPSINEACYKEYYTCSGPPSNTLGTLTCTQADYVFIPGATLGSGSCNRGNANPNCPACAGKVDGLYELSTVSHDCRFYLRCTNEQPTTLQCLNVTINGNEVRPTYWNQNTQSCQQIPQQANGFCNPVQGYWSAWVNDGAGCSVRNNGLCQQRQVRSCSNPAPFPTTDASLQCPGSPEQFVTCGSNACGDAFCIGRALGDYSKSLTLTPPIDNACFAEYIRCSGPPTNLQTFLTCTQADYIFDPAQGACRRGNADNACPNQRCAAKTNGFHVYESILEHDCRLYVNCTNEIAVQTLSCPPVNGQLTYFDPGTRTCQFIPTVRSVCNYIQGNWGGWGFITTCARDNNNNCVRTQRRECSNPAPKNDTIGCGGRTIEDQVVSCLASECALACDTNPCPSNSFCTNVGNSFTCTCNSGYEASGAGTGANLVCADINECLTNNGNCGNSRFCINTVGSFSCAAAYCENNANPCTDSAAVCVSVSTSLGYQCACPSGYTQVTNAVVANTQCTDIDECLNVATCGTTQRCVNTIGSWICLAARCLTDNPCTSPAVCTSVNTGDGYVCTCPAGYTTTTNSITGVVTCTDINECLSLNGGCASNRVCQNTVGSFVCLPSYCENNNFPCSAGSSASVCTSVSTSPGYTCTCRSGYTQSNGNGASAICTDINECLTNNGGCAVGQICTNTVGSFTCSAGNICLTNNPCVGANTQCAQSSISPFYTCSCQSGYQVQSGSGASLVCVDINECLSNNGGCGNNRVCVNTAGSFSCLLSYCENNANPCVNSNAVCVSVSTSPGYTCTCPAGFTLSGTGANVVCTDINECLTNNGGCAANQVCTNTAGSFICTATNICVTNNPCVGANTQCTQSSISPFYTCSCQSGYQIQSGSGASLVCVDTNECLTNNGGCASNRVCTNTAGSFICQLSYCENNVNPCVGANAVCTSVSISPGYTCSCPSGFTLSGTGANVVCTDINECLTNNGGCASNRVCVNTAGSFTCQLSYCENNANPCVNSNAVCTSVSVSPGYTCSCPSGFTLSGSGANVVCTDINECLVNNGGCASNRVCTNLAGTFRCELSYCENQANPCVNSNAVCTSVSVSPGYTCTCPSGFTLSGTGANVVCTPIVQNSCVNQTLGARFADSSNSRQFLQCDGNGGSTVVTCPNAQLAVGLDANNNEIFLSNGIYYSEYFKTCVNTTTGAAPAGTNLNNACSDIADTNNSETKLPLDDALNGVHCKRWLTCKGQVLQNSQQTPPEAGECNSNFYDRDARVCSATIQCPL